MNEFHIVKKDKKITACLNYRNKRLFYLFVMITHHIAHDKLALKPNKGHIYLIFQ